MTHLPFIQIEIRKWQFENNERANWIGQDFSLQAFSHNESVWLMCSALHTSVSVCPNPSQIVAHSLRASIPRLLPGVLRGTHVEPNFNN